MKNKIEGVILSEERHNELLEFERIVNDEKTIKIKVVNGHQTYNEDNGNWDWIDYETIHSYDVPANQKIIEFDNFIENRIYTQQNKVLRLLTKTTNERNRLKDKINNLQDEIKTLTTIKPKPEDNKIDCKMVITGFLLGVGLMMFYIGLTK